MIKTIGHSNHPIERFIALLQAGDITELVDVRSVPYSRRFPQFGMERLTKSLSAAGIAYVWEGEALGGKGAGSYTEAAARPAFKVALGRLVERSAADGSTLCLMCAEKEPLDCHRTVLVSRRLAERGAKVQHLLADGSAVLHAEVEETLLAKSAGGRGIGDLFLDRAALLAQAYDARERAIKRL
jgi:uncharacterized protein (DUF488 family)